MDPDVPEPAPLKPKYRRDGKGGPSGKGRGKARKRRPSKLPFLMDEEREWILTGMDKGKDDAQLAALFRWPEAEVAQLRAEYYSRTSLAGRYLKAKALELAQRVVKDASVAESLDVLSRPGMVLEPAVKAAGHPKGFGVFASVQTGQLGGVQMAVGIVQGEAPQTPALETEPVLDVPARLTGSNKG